MNGLTPEARALIEEARVGEDPTTSDFDRVMHGARRRLVMAGVFALMLGAGRVSSKPVPLSITEMW
jgi:hypothetical protein